MLLSAYSLYSYGTEAKILLFVRHYENINWQAKRRKRDHSRNIADTGSISFHICKTIHTYMRRNSAKYRLEYLWRGFDVRIFEKFEVYSYELLFSCGVDFEKLWLFFGFLRSHEVKEGTKGDERRINERIFFSKFSLPPLIVESRFQVTRCSWKVNFTGWRERAGVFVEWNKTNEVSKVEKDEVFRNDCSHFGRRPRIFFQQRIKHSTERRKFCRIGQRRASTSDVNKSTGETERHCARIFIHCCRRIFIVVLEMAPRDVERSPLRRVRLPISRIFKTKKVAWR